jgi:hypothetical protein
MSPSFKAPTCRRQANTNSRGNRNIQQLMKPEIREPKSERRPKFEIRRPRAAIPSFAIGHGEHWRHFALLWPGRPHSGRGDRESCFPVPKRGRARAVQTPKGNGRRHRHRIRGGFLAFFGVFWIDFNHGGAGSAKPLKITN